jgi:uncharacterized RDD family membrane protein YckC
MKCPKCGYVGFEETPRCRHCGYDFSFAAPVDAAAAVPVAVGAAAAMPAVSAADEFFADGRVDPPPSLDRLGFVDLERLDDQPVGPMVDLPLATVTPSDLFAESPPPARPPLAVRRASERPRSRPTTQVLRRPAASLLDVPVAHDDAATDPIAAGPPGPASLAARLTAGLLDLGLLAGIALAVVYLTVRLAGLTMAELDMVPPLPLAAFLVGWAAAYLAAFTACGGQTLGKMALGVRVVADDGAVPPGAAALRAFTALAGAALGGLGFLPAFFDGDHRGVHDRLAGTRVVRL